MRAGAIDMANQIQADGKIKMPFDRAALPLLREIGRWDAAAKVWRVRRDASEADVARIAEALGLVDQRPADQRRAASAPANPRAITAEGIVRFPFDRQALPLARQIATWDPGAQSWRLRTDADPRLVSDVAARMGLVDERPATRAVADVPPHVIPEALAARLYPYQRTGAVELARSRRRLLADEQGLGKTVQVLAALGAGARAIVVCPASLRANWAAEVARWRPDLRATVVRGRGKVAVPKAGEVAIHGYEALASAAALAAIQSADLSEVTVVADEAHFCKNYRGAKSTAGSKRAKAVAALCERAARAWLLTGTPLKNQPPDLYGLLSVGGMAHTVFGGWRRFCEAFGAVENRWGGTEWRGDPAPWVAEALRSVMIRRMKAEVLPDLPPKRWSDMTVEASAEVVRELDELAGDHAEWLDSDELPGFEDFSKVRQMLAVSRIPALLDLVTGYEAAETPLVVASAHRAPIEALRGRAGWGVILGGESADAKADVVRRFQQGELVGVGLTIGAGGTGITLTRAATMVMVDLAWTAGENAQVEDRIHRIGTTESPHIIRMVSDHPLDLHVHRLLARKTRVIQEALAGDWRYQAPSSVQGESHEARAARLELIIAEHAAVRRDEVQAKVHAVAEREATKAEDLGMPALPMTEERRQAIAEALGALASRCDGAVEKDGEGFSKPDATVGAWLAEVGLGEDDTARVAEAILWRYAGRRVAGRYSAGQIRRAPIWGAESEEQQ